MVNAIQNHFTRLTNSQAIDPSRNWPLADSAMRESACLDWWLGTQRSAQSFSCQLANHHDLPTVHGCHVFFLDLEQSICGRKNRQLLTLIPTDKRALLSHSWCCWTWKLHFFYTYCRRCVVFDWRCLMSCAPTNSDRFTYHSCCLWMIVIAIVTSFPNSKDISSISCICFYLCSINVLSALWNAFAKCFWVAPLCTTHTDWFCRPKPRIYDLWLTF